MPDPSKRRRPLKPGRHAQQRKGKLVPADMLRKLFNDDGILEKADKGQLTVRVVKDAHPSPPLADEPICTQSQLLAYYDLEGKKVAEAHQYRRTDGTIGASGKPDPKEVLHGDTLYLLDLP